MRLREILTERILNLYTVDQKKKYADQIWGYAPNCICASWWI